jgi:uncharacterized protein YdbL (DUF1318 family)
MQDLFEYPTITATQPEEQVKELVHYLVQFKETLEFALGNISTDNLSGDLVSKLNTLGADIKRSNDEREEQFQQVAHNQGATVSDVLNSEAYKASIKAVSDKIPTEYLESVEQTQTSEEAGGINIYAFTDASGNIQEFTVRNGKTPVLELSVNYETGNLEYTVT